MLLLFKYKWAILAAVVTVAAFSSGWWVNGLRWEAKLADAAIQAEAARIELAQDNAEVIAEYADKADKIKIVTRTVIKRIIETPNLDRCNDDDWMRFSSEWNAVARQANGVDESLR